MNTNTPIITLLFILITISSCQLPEELDNITLEDNPTTLEDNPTALWDNNTEPRTTDVSSSEIQFSWTPLSSASSYQLFNINSWGPPVEETLLSSTTLNSISIHPSTTGGHVWIKALDESSDVIDMRAIYVGYNYGPLNDKAFLTGVFTDDFEDNIIDSVYYTQRSDQMSETNGYLQLSQNETDDGPYLYISYDTEYKRYLRFTTKWFQHRAGNYYSGEIRFTPFENNYNRFNVTNQHYSSIVGTYINSRVQNEQNHTPIQDTTEELSSMEIFDTWFTWDIMIDTQNGDIKVKVNSDLYTSTTSDVCFRNKFNIMISPYGWFTGHYVRIDDLRIESSDTPFF